MSERLYTIILKSNVKIRVVWRGGDRNDEEENKGKAYHRMYKFCRKGVPRFLVKTPNCPGIQWYSLYVL